MTNKDIEEQMSDWDESISKKMGTKKGVIVFSTEVEHKDEFVKIEFDEPKPKKEKVTKAVQVDLKKNKKNKNSLF